MPAPHAPAAPPRSRPPAATAPARAARSPPEGKARASRNALKHGLAALHHFVLEDEAPSELEELTARLLAELGAGGEIEARLVKRIAIAFWKGERAERIEVALFDAAPKLRPPKAGYDSEEADPLTTFDIKRFNAVRGYQAQQGRELSRCLKELRLLRRDPLADCTDEPEARRGTNPSARPSPPMTMPASAAFVEPATRDIVAERTRPRPTPRSGWPSPADRRQRPA